LVFKELAFAKAKHNKVKHIRLFKTTCNATLLVFIIEASEINY
jgi:hypothetical protein